MSSAVIILVAGNTPAEPMAWVRLASGAVVATGMVAGGESIRGVSGECILVVPGFDAQLRRLETPTRSAPQARAAAAHLFRDSLATDAAETVFAVGDVGVNDQRLAAAMSRTRLVAWLARCADMRLKPRAVYLDCSLLPTRAGGVDVMRLGERTLVSAGELGAFTMDSDLAPAVLGQWIAQLGDAVETAYLHGWTREQLAPQLGAISLQVDAAEEDPVIRLARCAVMRPARAPDFAATLERAGPSASSIARWALAASLAVAAGLIQIGLTVWDGLRDADATQTVLAAAEAEFREARPEVKRIANLRAQITGALNATKPQVANPVIAASPMITDVLELHPDVQLDEVRLNAGRTVELRLSSLLQPQLDSAIEGLREAAGKIDVGPMQAVDGRTSIAVLMGGV
jgi:type II secretion system protein L